jgi:hypothetical protein
MSIRMFLANLVQLLLSRSFSNVRRILNPLTRLSFAMQVLMLRIASMAKGSLVTRLNLSLTFENERGDTSWLALHLQGFALSLINGRKLKT